MSSRTANAENADTTAVTVDSQDASSNLAQAFKELTRGEVTARELENNLDNLEKKLDELLASFDENERERVAAAGGDKAEQSST